MSTFECKIKFRKEGKLVTETYLVGALSFTEAEANITSEMQAYLSEPFKVVNIKLSTYSEVVRNEGRDGWFKAKVTLLVFDDETGKTKKQNIYILVQADDVKQAYSLTEVAMKGTLSEYKISAVSETVILDVFKK